MGLIKRSDLTLDYDWSTQPGDGPIDQDELESTAVFNSQRGEDILTLLNNYAEKKDTDRKVDVLQAEDIIRKELPKDLNTQDDVMDWLWVKMGNTKKAL